MNSQKCPFLFVLWLTNSYCRIICQTWCLIIHFHKATPQGHYRNGTQTLWWPWPRSQDPPQLCMREGGTKCRRHERCWKLCVCYWEQDLGVSPDPPQLCMREGGTKSRQQKPVFLANFWVFWAVWTPWDRAQFPSAAPVRSTAATAAKIWWRCCE